MSDQNITKILEEINNSKKYKTREQIWHSIIKDFEPKVAAEFGVFNGRSINFLSAISPDSIFHGFDSFEGLPETWIPGREKGYFATDLSKLRFHSNVKIHKGWFSETIPVFLSQTDLTDLKFIHIDCDIYSSTKTIITLLKDVMIRNKCVLLFDEFYNYKYYLDHEIKAFSEFVQENNINYRILGRNINHQQVIIQIL